MAAPAKQAPVAFNVSADKPDKSGPFGERLQRATAHFRKILNRDPTEQEIARIGTFIAAPNNSEMVLMDGPVSITAGQISKPSCTGYSLYFEEKKDSTKGNVDKAVEWFKKFNGRDPDQQEKIKIQQFLKEDK